jgi:hypothetical protein
MYGFQEAAVVGGDQVGREPHAGPDLIVQAGPEPSVGHTRPVFSMPGPVTPILIEPEGVHDIIIYLYALPSQPEYFL